MTSHPLQPLLAPQSIAFVGASIKPDSVGNNMVRMPKLAGYGGRIYPIHPTYDAVEDLRCYPSLEQLPERVDHVVLGVANGRLEAALDAAIAHGARAATIFASCHLENDTEPALASRLARRAREAGLVLCGGNCMGFYNLEANLRVVGFPSPLDMKPGPIAFIAQSGSVFGALAHNDRRLKFNLAVSSGAEFVTGVADYLDWALEQDSTRVVALFLEAVRDPAKFTAGLKKAAERNVPIVVLKVGRTEASASMAVSHTGALAGSDAAYEALFQRYGVIRVDTLDEMAATLLLLAHPKRPARGTLVAMHDSGGEREMVVDLAEKFGVPYAAIGQETKQRVAVQLEPGLDAANPLDAWGTGDDYERRFTRSMGALIDDPAAAVGVLFLDVRDGYHLHDGFCRAMLRAAEETAKPIAIATNYSMVRHEDIALRTTEAGVPVLDGTEEALLAVRHALAYRDFCARTRDQPSPVVPTGVREKWRRRLTEGNGIEEADALDLLSDYGVAVPRKRLVDSLETALDAAESLGYPVAIKTAEPAIAHKTDAGGVKLALAHRAAVAEAYADLAARLGPRVLVEEMVPAGVEIGVGAIHDPQFGPYVMIAAGGVLIELLNDRAVALAPTDHQEARQLLSRLRVSRLLAGVRGRPAADAEAVVDAVVRISLLAHDLRDAIAEIDVNPLIVGASGAVAVDALIVRRR